MRLNLVADGNPQKIVLNYLEENVSDVLMEKINSGKKTMDQCWRFIQGEAKKKAKNGCACIEDREVFGWAVHFFEEDSISGEEKQTIKAAGGKEVTVTIPKVKKEVVKVEKKVEKKSELEESQISLFDLMGMNG